MRERQVSVYFSQKWADDKHVCLMIHFFKKAQKRRIKTVTNLNCF